MENKFSNKTYFAAANGYAGFRSNFDKIFSPHMLEKLFIIKGGPGTGKSTLMKKIKDKYCNEATITTVLCSSDPNSLDGLLISKNGLTVGIVDGTAPHVVEPEYPGAVEEIINLGDGFDYKKLSHRKNEIFNLSKVKKEEYKSAYDSLKLAGLIYDYINDCLLDCEYYNKAEMLLEDLINNEKSQDFYRKKTNYLIGAFSRDGYKRLQITSDKKRIVRISGDGISEYLLMSQILQSLEEKSISYCVYTSAFSNSLQDAIECENTLYTTTEDENCSVDSLQLIAQNSVYKSLKAAYDSVLNNARLSLLKASEYHFKMEDIYNGCMQFKKNEERYVQIINSIDTLFKNNVE